MDDTTHPSPERPPAPPRGHRQPRPRRRPRRRTLQDLRPHVREGRYRIGGHAVKHAACEGFTERDIVGAVLYGRELMRYLDDERLLVLGYIPAGSTVKIPLHVVIEYRKARWVDVVTAFIPSDPHRVVSRARLAEMLRYDRHEPRARRVGRGAQEDGSP